MVLLGTALTILLAAAICSRRGSSLCTARSSWPSRSPSRPFGGLGRHHGRARARLARMMARRGAMCRLGDRDARRDDRRLHRQDRHAHGERDPAGGRRERGQGARSATSWPQPCSRRARSSSGARTARDRWAIRSRSRCSSRRWAVFISRHELPCGPTTRPRRSPSTPSASMTVVYEEQDAWRARTRRARPRSCSRERRPPRRGNRSLRLGRRAWAERASARPRRGQAVVARTPLDEDRVRPTPARPRRSARPLRESAPAANRRARAAGVGAHADGRPPGDLRTIARARSGCRPSARFSPTSPRPAPARRAGREATWSRSPGTE